MKKVFESVVRLIGAKIIMAPAVVNLPLILSTQAEFVFKGADKFNTLEDSIEGRQMTSARRCRLRRLMTTR